MSERGWEAVHVDELDSIPVAGVVWHPVRRRLGIEAFGMNAYTAEAVGKQIVEEHDESSLGHQEVYVVVRGSVTFTVGGENAVNRDARARSQRDGLAGKESDPCAIRL